jgi:cell division protein ZapA
VTNDQQLILTIAGREYRVACAPAERDDLMACARYVDMKMNAIREGGKVMGADRVAVLAALHMAQELFAAKAAGGLSMSDVRKRVKLLNELADDMLAPQEKLF